MTNYEVVMGSEHADMMALLCSATTAMGVLAAMLLATGRAEIAALQSVLTVTAGVITYRYRKSKRVMMIDNQEKIEKVRNRE